MSLQSLPTTNLMVPAEGGVDVMSIAVPGDLGGLYTIDFRSLAQEMGGIPFIPQACTLDLSLLSAGLTITFVIPALGYRRVFEAGTTTTFQFPALQNLSVQFIPSAGTPSFPSFWYNYPAMPDGGGGATQLVTDAGVVAQLTSIQQSLQQPPGDTGTDFSANAPSLLANLVATIPVNVLRKGYFVQNQDSQLVQVVIDDGAGVNVTIIYLAAAAVSPGAGGSVDMSGIPTQGRIRVFSGSAVSPIAAHDF